MAVIEGRGMSDLYLINVGVWFAVGVLVGITVTLATQAVIVWWRER